MIKSINFKIYLFAFLCILNTHFIFTQTDNAPVISATGRQQFCVGNPINIVTDFSISDSDDSGIGFFFVQISSGYQNGFDRLELTGSHPKIIPLWNADEGKLTLIASASGQEILFPDLENAVKDIQFTTSSNNVVSEKTFSLTIDNANYLPSTDRFYEFVPNEGITWNQARIAAENRTFYGRQGYLATLTSQEEADFAGKQASGAGWIGGSDEETEGEWKWVTGPEAGTIFWRGQVSGTTPNFAFWNNNEPNDFGGNEDYAHITDPSIGKPGAWNDLPLVGGTGLYVPRGYIVEYGIPGDAPLNIVASTSIYIPQIISTVNATVCESGTVTISAIPSEGEILWYADSDRTNQNEIARGNDYVVSVSETTTYYASISLNGCNTLDRIPVIITVNDKPTIVNTTDDLICEGTAVLSAEASAGDVYWYDSLTSTTPIFIGDSYQTPIITSTTSYFVEANNATCESANRTEVIAEVDATIPEFDISQANYVLCKDIGSVDLEVVNFQDNYRYVWKKEGELLVGNLSTISVNSSGNYSVYAISAAGCESLEQNVVVSDSEKATITKEDIIITDDSDNNSIQIADTNLGSGNYEFAIDNIAGVYSDQTIFSNLSTGIHSLYIRDKGGCGVAEYRFSILAYPKFFTPNGDTVNDLWKIDGYDKDFYTVSNIYIYNRYGNLIYIIKEESEGWDGNFQGKPLPSNNYWFRTFLTDINGFSIEKTGNFSLIRK